MNLVSDTTKTKLVDLTRNIEQYRRTATKIEESVAHLSEIQREIRSLNRPIGYRVEDAEEVLKAHDEDFVEKYTFVTVDQRFLYVCAKHVTLISNGI